MSLKSKKFISLFLAFSLVMLSVHLYAKERRGAELIIQRIGDQVRQVKKTRLEGTPWETSVITGIRGELIAVKQNSLLLLDTEGKDVSIDIEDIKVIRIVKKSKVLLGVGLGMVVGGGGGALISIISGWSVYEGGEGMAAVLSGGVGAIAGLLIGGTIGTAVGKDKTIRIEGKSDSEIQDVMDKLRKKARIRDYK
jgi:hypothetical protein